MSGDIATKKIFFRAFMALITMTICITEAAANDSSGFTLEEVIVTAQKRESSLQDTAVAVTAIGSETLENFAVADITDITAFTPNANLAEFGAWPGSFSPYIRGLGVADIEPGIDPVIATFVNGIYLPTIAGSVVDTFDIESIEVLRGPQGTLFGRNTTGGAILINSKRPGDKNGFELEFGAGSYGLTESKLAADIVISESLRSRFVGTRVKSDGYYDLHRLNNSLEYAAVLFDIPDAPIPTGTDISTEDYGGKDLFTFRSTFVWEPSDSFDSTLIIDYVDDNSQGEGLVNQLSREDAVSILPAEFGGGPRFLNASLMNGLGLLFPETTELVGIYFGERGDNYDLLIGSEEIFFEQETLALSWENNWQLGAGTLTSLVGWRNYETSSFGLGDDHVFSTSDVGNGQDVEAQSLELRYASDQDARFSFIAGFYYGDSEFDRVLSLGDGSALSANTMMHQEAQSMALFAQTRFSITEQLILTAGARYTEEEKEAAIGSGLFAPGFGFFESNCSGTTFTPGLGARTPVSLLGNLDGCENTFVDDEDWSSFGPQIGVEYLTDNGNLFYISYQRAFRSGGFNGRTFFGNYGPYDEEQVDNIELGMKTEFWDGKARLNAAIFNAKYDDYQVDLLSAGVETQIANAAELDIKGAELELTLIPVSTLMLVASVGYLDTGYESFAADVANAAGLPFPDGIPDLDLTDFGIGLRRSPDLTYSLGIVYDINMNDLGDIRLSFNYNYIDDLVHVTNGNPRANQDGYGNLKTSIRWDSSNESWYANLYAKNLTDEQEFGSGSSATSLLPDGSYTGSPVWLVPNAPRELGINIGYKY